MGRPEYHLCPPAGWMNDPNGFCFFGGRYHLFYQHYPKAPRWGRMSWGHAASDDLVHWEHLPVALKPDSFWDGLLGCFSGSAIERGGELHLMYTGVSALGQYQMLARSKDGITFRKRRRPVIGPGNLPPGGSAQAFRDPKVFERDGRYYCLVGGDEKLPGRARGAQISLYRSDDLESWTYVGTLALDDFPYRGIFECPDLARVDGKDILLASPMYLPKNGDDEFENLHSAVYVPGTLDAEGGAFEPDDGAGVYRELDGGTDFYAPQTMAAPDGRVFMVAWMQMWKRTVPTAKDGWAGSMTFPRELSFVGGSLIQRPVSEIERYRVDTVAIRDRAIDGTASFPGVDGTVCDLEIELDIGGATAVGVRLFVSPRSGNAPPSYAELRYDRAAGAFTLDRSRAPVAVLSRDRREAGCDVRTTRLPRRDGPLVLRLLLDRNSLEVFACGGVRTMSALYYAPDDHAGIEFFSEGPARIVELRKHDIRAARPASRWPPSPPKRG